MDIAVPLTLETVSLVMQVLPKKFNSATPEHLYNLFYREMAHTHIYIFSNGNYYFATESDLEDREYVPVTVTVEEAREILFIRSLET